MLMLEIMVLKKSIKKSLLLSLQLYGQELIRLIQCGGMKNRTKWNYLKKVWKWQIKNFIAKLDAISCNFNLIQRIHPNQINCQESL